MASPSFLLVVLSCVGMLGASFITGLTGFGQAIIFQLVWQLLSRIGVSGAGDLHVSLIGLLITGVFTSSRLMWTIHRHHRDARWDLVIPLLIGASIFVWIGTFLLKNIAPEILERALGVLFLIFAAWQLYVRIREQNQKWQKQIHSAAEIHEISNGEPIHIMVNSLNGTKLPQQLDEKDMKELKEVVEHVQKKMEMATEKSLKDKATDKMKESLRIGVLTSPGPPTEQEKDKEEKVDLANANAITVCTTSNDNETHMTSTMDSLKLSEDVPAIELSDNALIGVEASADDHAATVFPTDEFQPNNNSHDVLELKSEVNVKSDNIVLLSVQHAATDKSLRIRCNVKMQECRRLGSEWIRRPLFWKALGTGTLSGILQGVFSTGGPPVMIFFSFISLNGSCIRSTFVTFSWLLQFNSFISTAVFGIWDFSAWPLYLCLPMFAMIGVSIGNIYHSKVDTNSIVLLLQILIILSTISLTGVGDGSTFGTLMIPVYVLLCCICITIYLFFYWKYKKQMKAVQIIKISQPQKNRQLENFIETNVAEISQESTHSERFITNNTAQSNEEEQQKSKI